jgi:GT2 family glycosyltransferase
MDGSQSILIGPPSAGGAKSFSQVRAAGKFLFAGDKKFYIRGVTYGPFNPLFSGGEYHTPDVVARDFSLMAANGINAVRTYSAPPRWVLDIASQHGLRVMAGIAWTQHVGFFDHEGMIDDACRMTDAALNQIGVHPALLALAIGNEIPARVVRWYGHRRVEKHLKTLCSLVKQHNPQTLVTYANYPSTEYLELPFLDFVSFNVYLEQAAQFDAYLARLQNLAGDRPLVLSEIGVDSGTHGEAGQAAALAHRINSIFDHGSAGMFIFSFTDEWFRHGMDIHQWRFGLVDRQRKPRIALSAVATHYLQTLPRLPAIAPRVSVIICSYNGATTIAQTITQTLKLDYPAFEVIVVDDGSTAGVSEIARQFPVRLIAQPNLGLGVARNTGLHAATGEIVAYLDDDAFPDPHWLVYLVKALQQDGAVGAGGPNLPVPGDCPMAQCVANTPGGPSHVLLSDTVAEHIPGCNMAFIRTALLRFGGFDPRFRIAGDDVDLCWRIQDCGGRIAFAPAAMVWHHRRKTVAAFLKQQLNYGRAEADLERKWPHKFNRLGHVAWGGSLYGTVLRPRLFGPSRIYHGVWGEAAFQQNQTIKPSALSSLPMMPEWYLLLGALAAATALGWLWSPLWLAGPVLILAIAYAWLQAIIHAHRAPLQTQCGSRVQRITMRLQIAALCRLQPLARAVGRCSAGLTPWRSRSIHGFMLPLPTEIRILAPKWKLPTQWLESAEKQLIQAGIAVSRGSAFDRWDLQIRSGLLSSIRVQLLTEDVCDEQQLVRWRMTPHVSVGCLAALVFAATLTIVFAADRRWSIFVGLAVFLATVIAQSLRSCGAVMATFRKLQSGKSKTPAFR